MRGLERSRGTIFSIGAVTTMPASAQAPIAASPETTANMPSPSANPRKPGSQAVATSGHGIEQDERLSPQNSADEYLLMGLRLAEGIDVTRLKAIDGRKLDDARLQQLEAQGLVKRTPGRLRATDTGRLVLDRLIVELAA